MSANPTSTPSLSDHLTEPLRLGDPDVQGPLTVFPVFGPEPRLAYVSFAQGRAAGASIKELQSGASVNDLIVLNPTDVAVLLYEGEEVLGAQQNRTFDVSVLVGPRTQLQVPVSCVEAGRWDGRRGAESFTRGRTPRSPPPASRTSPLARSELPRFSLLRPPRIWRSDLRAYFSEWLFRKITAPQAPPSVTGPK